MDAVSFRRTVGRGSGLFLKMALFGQEKSSFCRLLRKSRHLFTDVL